MLQGFNQFPVTFKFTTTLFFHVLAFREVFDIFDSNGGGTIDAEELDEALRTADIQLSKDEIDDVLTSMDKDGMENRLNLLAIFCLLNSQKNN